MTDLNTKQKCMAIRRYFTVFPKWPLAGLVLAALLMHGEQYALGVVASLASIGATWFYLSHRANDADYDRIRSEAVDFLLDTRALSRWGITREELTSSKLPWFYSPALDSNTGTAASKRGKDGQFRYNPVRFSIFGFGEDQMWTYTGLLDLITHNVLAESTEEFFYEHVVGLSTQTESRRFVHKGKDYQLNDNEMFTLTSTANTKVSVMIRSPSMASLFGVEDVGNSHAQTMIAIVRKTLRDKQRDRLGHHARPDPLC